MTFETEGAQVDMRRVLTSSFLKDGVVQRFALAAKAA